MHAEEILRSFYQSKVQSIERIIHVDYDNQRQLPVSFVHEKRRHQIIKVINKDKGNLSPEDLTFTVQTDNAEVYVLDLHVCAHPAQGQFYKAFWILSSRIVLNTTAARPVPLVG